MRLCQRRLCILVISWRCWVSLQGETEANTTSQSMNFGCSRMNYCIIISNFTALTVDTLQLVKRTKSQSWLQQYYLLDDEYMQKSHGRKKKTTSPIHLGAIFSSDFLTTLCPYNVHPPKDISLSHTLVLHVHQKYTSRYILCTCIHPH